jgi:high-affinity iron transporter|tara:strand:- start:5731 stop:6555 length:825 start_codon:yes stop_codon:yes gene_type:complete
MAELLIMFREVLEASLIIGILYTFLIQSKQPHLIRQLWKGVGFALIASIIFSFIFQIFAGGFQGNASKLFEGAVMIMASLVLGTMIVWMAKNVNIKAQLEKEATEAMNSSNAGFGIFSLAFIAVFREGVEIILFMYSIMLTSDGISIISSTIGSLIGLFIGYLIFVKGKKVPLKQFFNFTSIFLIFVCAGMMAYGIHELESGGLIHDYGRFWDINPAKNLDGSYPLFHDKGMVGSLFKGFFGYNGNPSLIEFIAWLMTLVTMGYSWKKITSKNS